MLKNYLTIAVRNIRRSVSYTLINVLGLSLGMACALLIFSMVTYHLNFDDFHNDSDRIYRFVTEQHRDQVTYAAGVPPVFGKAFREDYAFGEKVARLFTSTDELVSADVGGELKKFNETISFAEPAFFDIFNFPLISGSKDHALNEPNTAIISERVAKKYFGEESPVGKTLRFNDRIAFIITGVLKNVPENTDLRSEIYFSYASIKEYNEWYAADDAWGGITTNIQTFVRLRPGVAPAEVELVLPAYVKKYRAESKNVHHYKLQPLDDVHFNSKYSGRMDKSMIWILSAIGALLVFTACLNFINLATAQAISRSREVGVRKALGSARAQLFWQFTTETGVIVALASLLAFTISYSVLPFVNDLFSTRASLVLTDFRLLLFFLLLMVTVTFLSGSYPGLILSGFKPVQALKGKLPVQQPGSFNLRRVLITTQFTISQILLIGLIVFVYQMQHFKGSDLGFNQDAVVMMPVGSADVKMNTLKEQFLQIPQVESVSACFSAPASASSWSTMMRFDNREETENFAVSFRGADEHYLSTFDIDLVAGRNLTPSDTIREFLVNEKLISSLNLSSAEEILGKTMSVNSVWTGPVVGVVNNFHDKSFRSGISPVVIATSRENYHEYAVKINMQDASSTLSALEKTWSDMYPEKIFDYDFLDEQTAAFYRVEEMMMKLIQAFSFIALFVGCMGLYGLVSFMAVQKTKEIGIRKVLGGSMSHILWIFGKEFTRLVVIAFLVASPVAWWLLSMWLENYVYHEDITMWIFVLELVIILTIVLLTVGYQSVKAALMNPVNSLRTE